MIPIQLPPTTAERLDTLFRSTDDPKLRHRLQIVLMARHKIKSIIAGRPKRKTPK